MSEDSSEVTRTPDKEGLYRPESQKESDIRLEAWRQMRIQAQPETMRKLNELKQKVGTSWHYDILEYLEEISEIVLDHSGFQVMRAQGRQAVLRSLDAWQMKSIW